MSAARALARAEAAGIQLRLGPDRRVKMRGANPPPPDVLEELRRCREDVAHLLALRATAASPPPEPLGWLASIARSVRAALADGAVPVADPEGGWLVLVRPDGRRLAVTPAVAAQLAEAGLMPDLPGVVAEPEGADAEAVAEREAIRGEPALPPEGTPERAAADRRQAEAVRGLLEASRVLPSCFPGEARRPPPAGSYCSCCSGRRWWFPRRPATDGSGISPHWRCSACRPPVRPHDDQIVRIET